MHIFPPKCYQTQDICHSKFKKQVKWYHKVARSDQKLGDNIWPQKERGSRITHIRYHFLHTLLQVSIERSWENIASVPNKKINNNNTDHTGTRNETISKPKLYAMNRLSYRRMHHQERIYLTSPSTAEVWSDWTNNCSPRRSEAWSYKSVCQIIITSIMQIVTHSAETN